MGLIAPIRDRRLLAAIGLLALAVVLAQLLLWWLGPPPRQAQIVGPPRSGYTLTDFSLVQYGTDGRPSFRLRAPQLQRREGDSSLYINAPVFDLPAQKPGVPDWHGHSLYGWVNHDGTLLKLQGAVHLQRPAYQDAPATVLDTAEVTAWPDRNRLETAAPVELVQGATRIHSVGMRADLDDKHLELLHEFHGIFPPRSR